MIEVEGMVAVCDGGGGALGHPKEYIELNTVIPNQVSAIMNIFPILVFHWESRAPSEVYRCPSEL